jgi:translation initiation factor IF-3
VKPLPEALNIARQMDLDLVEVAAEANPPVCKIMDYNRFKYEAAQRAKESRRKATSTGIKEMKYRPKIGIGDFETKTRQVARFLGEGHKVKITIMFRGREMSHPELGKRILDQVAENVANVAKVEAAPKLDGRNMIMVLAPDRRAQGRKPSANGARSGGAEPGRQGPATSPEAAAAETSGVVRTEVPAGPGSDPAGNSARTARSGRPDPTPAPAGAAVSAEERSAHDRIID